MLFMPLLFITCAEAAAARVRSSPEPNLFLTSFYLGSSTTGLFDEIGE
jgi:hypothetical protein